MAQTDEQKPPEKGARVDLDRFFSMEPPEKPKSAIAWAGKLELGLSGSEGNTKKFEGRLAFESVVKAKGFKFKYDLGYFYGEVEEIKSTNKLSTGIINDWRLPETRFLIFGQVRYDYDEFESWERRLSGHVGVGYYLVELKNFELILRAGAGGAKEFEPDNPPPIKEGLWGLELSWLIAPGQKFSASHFYYPDLEPSEEFRMTSQVKYEARINGGLSLSMGAQNEHQSEVEPGFEHNDFKYYTALVVAF